MRRLVWLLLLLVLACGAGRGRAAVVRAGAPVLTAEAGGALTGAGQLAVGESPAAWRGEPVKTKMSCSEWDAIDGGRKGNIIKVSCDANKAPKAILAAELVSQAAVAAGREPGQGTGMARVVPVIVSIVAVASAGASVNEKGGGWGAVNAFVDAVPILGSINAGIEMHDGKDVIPSTEEREFQQAEAEIAEVERQIAEEWAANSFSQLQGSFLAPVHLR